MDMHINPIVLITNFVREGFFGGIANARVYGKFISVSRVVSYFDFSLTSWCS